MTIVYKKSVVLAIIAIISLGATLSIAATSLVRGGKHDFSSSGTGNTYKDTNPASTQVCVYCHTPHNAGQARLLWNKDVKSATNFRLYTSSSSLSNEVRKKSSLDPNSPSLLCLSCHDGKTAVNVLHTGGSGTSASGLGYPAGSKFAFGTGEILMPGERSDMFGGITANMAIGRGIADRDDTIYPTTAGDDLTDDHPIGFSYSAAQSEKTAAHLNPIGTPKAAGIRFFGSNDKVECSSCHDPHVNYVAGNGGDAALTPFLVMSNTGSALCLSCHNK